MRPQRIRTAARRALGRFRWFLLGSFAAIGMIRCPPESREQTQQWLAQFRPDSRRPIVPAGPIIPAKRGELSVEDPFLAEAREGIAELERYLARAARDRNP
ncbi:MAG: hypothetical protein QG608_1729 [Actinomycetota bacterium]|nr:hypothetical protein [Actinomycetota bacterium]